MPNELKATVINMKTLDQNIVDPVIVGAGDANGRTLRVIFTQEAAAQMAPDTKVYLSWQHQENQIKGYNVFTEITDEDDEDFPPTWEIHYPQSMLRKGNVLACIQLVDSVSIATSVNFTIHVLSDPNAGETYTDSDDYSEFKTAVITLNCLADQARDQLTAQKIEFEDMQLAFMNVQKVAADTHDVSEKAQEIAERSLTTAQEALNTIIGLSDMATEARDAATKAVEDAAKVTEMVDDVAAAQEDIKTINEKMATLEEQVSESTATAEEAKEIAAACRDIAAGVQDLVEKLEAGAIKCDCCNKGDASEEVMAAIAEAKAIAEEAKATADEAKEALDSLKEDVIAEAEAAARDLVTEMKSEIIEEANLYSNHLLDVSKRYTDSKFQETKEYIDNLELATQDYADSILIEAKNYADDVLDVQQRYIDRTIDRKMAGRVQEMVDEAVGDFKEDITENVIPTEVEKRIAGAIEIIEW